MHGNVKVGRWSSVLLLLVGLPAAGLPAAAPPADAEAGLPFIASFGYREYGAHSQNWAAVQDRHGVMYFGNGAGVLVFDGVGWRTIPVANRSIVRSVAIARDGTLYVGAVHEIGYLSPDDRGVLTYVSLLDRLEPEERDLGNVWRTYATEEGVYFWSDARLLRWDGREFRSWEIASQRVPCLVDGRLFHNQKDVGLTVLEGEVFRPLAGGERLVDLSILTMLPYAPDRILVGTRSQGLFLLTLGQADRAVVGLERFATEADRYLREHRLYYGARLPDGAFAFATMTGGVFIIGPGGELVRRLSRAEGLAEDSVWSLYLDRQQGLWLALNQGLARVELGTPVTAFVGISGLQGTVEAIVRSDGTLYVASSAGIFRLRGERLERVAVSDAPYWSLLSFEVPGGGRPRLLAGATFGVHELRQGETRLLVNRRNTHQLHQSSRRPSVVYLGEAQGIGVLRFDDGEWVDQGLLPGIDDEVRSIAEDDDGHLWLGTLFDGIVRLTLEDGPVPRVRTVTHFGRDDGLPTMKSVKVGHLAGQLVFATVGGLYRFDSAARSFVPSDLLGSRLAERRKIILRLAADHRGNAWISFENGDLAVAARRDDGSYALDETVLNRIAWRSIHAIYPEPGGEVWFGGVEGLFRFDSTAGARLGAPEVTGDPGDAAGSRGAAAAATLIRSVSVTGSTPSFDEDGSIDDGQLSAVLFGGAAPPDEVPVLPYASSSLRFGYALPRFDAREENTYRSRLVGLDDAWSEWSKEVYRDFTTLREGRYRFEVEGRDVYFRSGGVAAFDFRVLPPWYRAPWAYGFYALGLVAAIWALFTWQLRRAKLRMELQRLAEANAMMQRTERQRERFVRRLKAQNAEMERFIYTVSHDLKSPLITIRGFLGLLEKDAAEGRARKMRHDIERIHRATGKMAELVNDLLELSRVGRVAHEPRPVSIGQLAKEAAEQIAGLIAERRAEVVISPRLPAAFGDPRRLREMLQNLIENAVKYMGDQRWPKVEIDCRRNVPMETPTQTALREAALPGTAAAEVVYCVHDNGIGIDPRYQEKIFGLFERLDSATEGSGVGLALVKRIIEVHGGRIWVESDGEGCGSSFCFTLPAPPGAIS